MLSFELRQIAGMAAGTYFVVRDNSAPSDIQVFENLRVIPISSTTGPTNQLVLFSQGDVASYDRLFGKTNRAQEKLGNYSVSSARQMIADGPTAVINLRHYTDLDTVQVNHQNLSIAPSVNPKDVVYSTLVREDGFWAVKPTNIAEVVGTEELLNLANVGNADVSFFTVFADKSDIDEITGEGGESFADMEIEVDEFPALTSNPNVKFGDSFVTVYVFKNNFLDSNTNEFYGGLFENGEITPANLKRLANISQSGFLQKLTGTLIPFVKSEFGVDISIDTVINSVATQTGLYAHINPDVFENESENELIDLFDKNALGYLSQLKSTGTGTGLTLGLDGFLQDTTSKLNKLSYQVNPILGKDLTEPGAMLFGNSVAAGVGINNYTKDLSLTESVTNEIAGVGFDAYYATADKFAFNNSVETIAANSLYNQTTEIFDLVNFQNKTSNKLHTILGGNLFGDFLSRDNVYVGAVPNNSIFNGVELVQKLNVENNVVGEIFVPKRTIGELVDTSIVASTSNDIFTGLLDKIQTAFTFGTEFNLDDATLENDLSALLLPSNEFINKLTDPNFSGKVNYREVIAALNNLDLPAVGLSVNVVVGYVNGEIRTYNNVMSYNYNVENKLNINPTDDRELFFLSGDIANNAINWEFTFDINPLYTKKQSVGKIQTTVNNNVIEFVARIVPTDVESNVYPDSSTTYKIVESTLTNLNFESINTVSNAINNPTELGLKLVTVNGDNNFKLNATTLTGLKLRFEQVYNGSPARQNEILDVLNLPSIVKGFKETRGLRYFIDGFKTFIEAGYKYQFNNVVLSLDKCNIFTRAIVNEPFISDLQKSQNPSFRDAIGNTRTLRLDKYLETGGNPQTSSLFLSKPNTAPEMVYYFGSEIQDRNSVRPIAPAVSKAFIDKERPWDIVANTTGVLTGIENIAINPDEPTRRAMERFGWNPIIKKGNQFVIFGDYSGNNAFKKRKALSFVSNSELLAYIKQELFNLSLDESFRKGTQNDFIRFETQVTNFMDDLALQNAIRANPIVQLNFENNTPDVLAAGIKLVNIEYVNFNTLDKVVFALDLS